MKDQAQEVDILVTQVDGARNVVLVASFAAVGYESGKGPGGGAGLAPLAGLS